MKPLGWVFHVRFPVLKVDGKLITLYMKDDYSPVFWGNGYEEGRELLECCRLHYRDNYNVDSVMLINHYPVYVKKPAPN